MTGRVLLETSEIIFRGERRVVVPFAAIRSARAAGGVLRIVTDEGRVAFERGPLAEKWLARIRNPKSVIDKLGVKPGQVVSVLGVSDAEFLRDASARAELSVGRLRKRSNLAFLGTETQATLK